MSLALLSAAIALAQLALLSLPSCHFQSLFSWLSSFVCPTVSAAVSAGLKPREAPPCLARCCPNAPQSPRKGTPVSLCSSPGKHQDAAN